MATQPQQRKRGSRGQGHWSYKEDSPSVKGNSEGVTDRGRSLLGLEGVKQSGERKRLDNYWEHLEKREDRTIRER